MPKQLTAAILSLLIAAPCLAQWYTFDVDTQTPHNKIVIKDTFEGNTPYLRSRHWEGGVPDDLSNNWSMVFWYGKNNQIATGIQIPGIWASSNLCEYLGATNTFFQSGKYYIAIRGIHLNGNKKTFGRGTMYQHYEPSSDTNLSTMIGAINIVWFTNNVGAQVFSNQTAITALQAGQGTNDTLLTDIQAQITSNDTEIVLLQAQNVSNETDITLLQAQNASNETDISTNVWVAGTNMYKDASAQTWNLDSAGVSALLLAISALQNGDTGVGLSGTITNDGTLDGYNATQLLDGVAGSYDPALWENNNESIRKHDLQAAVDYTATIPNNGSNSLASTVYVEQALLRIATNWAQYIASTNVKLNGHWLSQDGGNEGVYVDPTGRTKIDLDNANGTNFSGTSIEFEVDANSMVGLYFLMNNGWGMHAVSPTTLTFVHITDYDALSGSTGTFTLYDSGAKIGVAAGTTINEFSIDGTMAGNSDDALPTEQAVKTYVDASAASSTNWSPYPATTNVNLDNNWLSNDGTGKGIAIGDNGDVAVSGSVAVPTNIIWVGGNTVFLKTGDDIQTAVDAAEDGDTIQLGSGTHNITGSITITKQIHLKGAGQGATLLDSTGDTINIRTNNVIISDLSITNNANNEDGIRIGHISTTLADIVVRDVTINHTSATGAYPIFIKDAEALLDKVRIVGVSTGAGATINGIFAMATAAATRNITQTIVDCYVNITAEAGTSTIAAIELEEFSSTYASIANIYYTSMFATGDSIAYGLWSQADSHVTVYQCDIYGDGSVDAVTGAGGVITNYGSIFRNAFPSATVHAGATYGSTNEYDSSWDGSFRNAKEADIYEKIEAVIATIPVVNGYEWHPLSEFGYTVGSGPSANNAGSFTEYAVYTATNNSKNGMAWVSIETNSQDIYISGTIHVPAWAGGISDIAVRMRSSETNTTVNKIDNMIFDDTASATTNTTDYASTSSNEWRAVTNLSFPAGWSTAPSWTEDSVSIRAFNVRMELHTYDTNYISGEIGVLWTN